MIGLDEIRRARETIGDDVKRTPCLRSQAFSERCGAEVYLKYETLQMTGSFKARGALNTLRSLDAAEKQRGVVAASAGNHAQGVAWAASLTGVRSVIVMPRTTPLIKITRTRELGGDVRLHGDSFDDAFAEASELAERHDYVLVHAFDDERVIAGQGSIGLELLEQVPDLEAVVVPVGGGGIISGIATAIKETRPEVAIYGVQTEAAPTMWESFHTGEPVPRPAARSIAEGIVMKRPGRITFDYLKRHVDDLVLVSEAEIESAIFTLLETGKVLTEGAGAAGMAALLARHLPAVLGKRTAVVLCGANIDLNILNKIIERSLVRLARLCRLRIAVLDQPGGLADMLAVIAESGANVDRIRQSRIFTDSTFWEVEVELTLETRNRAHVDEVLTALHRAGYTKVKELGPQSVS